MNQILWNKLKQTQRKVEQDEEEKKKQVILKIQNLMKGEKAKFTSSELDFLLRKIRGF